MKRITYVMIAAFVLLLTACEKTEYVKRSYINESVMVDSVKDPMRNVEWLMDKQAEFYGANLNYDKYRALIMFVAYGDSVKQILEYHNHIDWIGDENGTSEIMNIRGYLYDLDGNVHLFDRANYAGTSFSTSTSNMIQGMIDMQLNNSVVSKISSLSTRVPRDDPRRPIIEEADTILNNATEIEILSCYKVEVVVK